MEILGTKRWFSYCYAFQNSEYCSWRRDNGLYALFGISGPGFIRKTLEHGSNILVYIKRSLLDNIHLQQKLNGLLDKATQIFKESREEHLSASVQEDHNENARPHENVNIE